MKKAEKTTKEAAMDEEKEAVGGNEDNTASEAEDPTILVEKERDEWKDKFVRLYSEYENFRKRTAKEKIDLSRIATEKLMLDLLGVLDDFDRAKENNETIDDAKAIKEGIELIYNKLYKARPTNVAADMFASLCALGAAIEKAGTIETGAVAAELRALHLVEFYGNISFDANGQDASREMLVLQNTPEPTPVTAETLVFPMPPWRQRLCKYVGPGNNLSSYTGTPLSVECSGHGKCDEGGSCVCFSGYGGTDCSEKDANSSVVLTALTIVFSLVVSSLALIYPFLVQRRRMKGLLRLQRTGRLPDFRMPTSCSWHVFLSHKWPTHH